MMERNRARGDGGPNKRGVNLDWTNAGASPLPHELRRFGWARLIARPPEAAHPTRPGETLAGYIKALRQHGVKVIVVLPRESFSDAGAIVPETITYARRLNPNVWQIGNEPDAGWHPSNSAAANSAAARRANPHNVSSWVMEPDEYANLVFNCAPAIRAARPNARIITAGFACGFASWMGQDVWDALVGAVDGVAVHPYLKLPQPDWPPDGRISGIAFPFVGELLDDYARFVRGKPLWVTEFGTTDQSLHEQYYARMYCTLQARQDVATACAFCYSSAMHAGGYGLIGTPAWRPFLDSPPLPFRARGVRAVSAGRPARAARRARRAGPAPITAIDVSGHQPRDLGHIIREYQPAHVIVKLYLPEESVEQDYSRDQMDSARAEGCSVGGYVWCYRSLDPARTVRDAVALARTSGVELPVLWLDCETYDGSEFDPGPDAEWLRAAVAEAARLGVRPGIYTGHWWVKNHFPGGTAAFAEFNDLPLWLADYDGVAELNFRHPFSGFTRLHGKQYAADGLDLDVFLEECCVLGDRPRTIEDVELENPLIREQLATWRLGRRDNGEDPFDYPAFRAHLTGILSPDCGATEFIGFCPADLASLRAKNPNLGRQLAEWQRARRFHGDDPCDYATFRDHLEAIGAPDSGDQPFTDFCHIPSDQPQATPRRTHRSTSEKRRAAPAAPARPKRARRPAKGARA